MIYINKVDSKTNLRETIAEATTRCRAEQILNFKKYDKIRHKLHLSQVATVEWGWRK